MSYSFEDSESDKEKRVEESDNQNSSRKIEEVPDFGVPINPSRFKETPRI
jgi:hypothetical protein